MPPVQSAISVQFGARLTTCDRAAVQTMLIAFLLLFPSLFTATQSGITGVQRRTQEGWIRKFRKNHRISVSQREVESRNEGRDELLCVHDLGGRAAVTDRQ